MPRRKTPYFPDYGRILPNAGPDWIWQRAVYLVESGRYATIRRDGVDACRAAAAYRAIKRDFSGRSDKQLRQSDHLLFETESFANGPVLTVLELKMRILAGQGVKTVAAKLGLSESFVVTFQKFFFDVADRLDAKSWIFQKVIGIQPGSSLSDEQLAMRDAYLRGPKHIEPWLDYLMHRFEEHDLTTAIGRQREALALQVAAENMSTDRETSQSLLKTLPLIRESRAKMFFLVSVNDQIRKNTLEMLRKVQFRAPANHEVNVSRGIDARGETEKPTVERCASKMVA